MTEMPQEKRRDVSSAASGFQRPWCAHSKFVRGCPSCAVHWLKSRGVVSVQPFTGNVVGLACLRRLRDPD